MSERLPLTWAQLLLLSGMYFATGTLLGWYWEPKLQDIIDDEVENGSVYPRDTLQAAKIMVLWIACAFWPLFLGWRTFRIVERKLFPRIKDEDEDEDGDEQ